MKDCLYNPSRMYNCPIIECEIKINDIENMLYHLEKGHACNFVDKKGPNVLSGICLLYTSPSPRDTNPSRMPSSA